MENTERQKRSFPVMVIFGHFQKSLVILSYSIYKYYLYIYYRKMFFPRNLNDLNDLDLNDRIEYFCFKDLQ